MTELDEIDRKIISQLQLNGRTTFEELGKLVGYTSMGAKKRVDRLLKTGVISISANLNTTSLNLFPAIVLLEMQSAEAMNELIKRFEYCPRVVHICTTLGGFNIIALVIAEDQETLESISMEKCSLRSGEGIRRSEFYPIGNIQYSPLLMVREYLTHKERKIAPCNVDCRPCSRYQSQKCVGCPTTQYYKGPL
ncbi:MAG: AsnC family transcriptional regulator [Candidatus Bathyarchaeota archaeon]|nr:AsnC family transcriptional regulator [Candidatus Bathyarchaeota archaeon]